MRNASQIQSSRSDRIIDLIVSVAICVFLFLTIYPLIFVISASFSSPMEVFAGKMWLLPKGFTTEAYKLVFRNKDIFIGYRNTVLYTAIGTFINVAMTMLGAYPLSRKKMYGRNMFMAYFTFTMFFSGGLIPTYLIIKSLGLYNTFWVMVIPGAVSVYNMIVARTYMQTTISEELYEAASIDGCSDGPAFFRIVLPLSAPIIAVLTLFYAVGHWNSYFNGLIYLGDRNRYPLQLILREILLSNMTGDMTEMLETDINKFLVSESLKYAVIIVSCLPMLVLYPFLQRFFIKGIMIGAIKG